MLIFVSRLAIGVKCMGIAYGVLRCLSRGSPPPYPPPSRGRALLCPFMDSYLRDTTLAIVTEERRESARDARRHRRVKAPRSLLEARLSWRAPLTPSPIPVAGVARPN